MVNDWWRCPSPSPGTGYLLSALANRMASISGLGSSSEKSQATLQTQARSLPQLGISVMFCVTENTRQRSVTTAATAEMCHDSCYVCAESEPTLWTTSIFLKRIEETGLGLLKVTSDPREHIYLRTLD